MEVTRAKNILEHSDEIYSRPARTWFQTAKEKKASKGKSKKLFYIRTLTSLYRGGSSQVKRTNICFQE
jgi:hypothetical protein